MSSLSLSAQNPQLTSFEANVCPIMRDTYTVVPELLGRFIAITNKVCDVAVDNPITQTAIHYIDQVSDLTGISPSMGATLYQYRSQITMFGGALLATSMYLLNTLQNNPAQLVEDANNIALVGLRGIYAITTAPFRAAPYLISGSVKLAYLAATSKLGLAVIGYNGLGYGYSYACENYEASLNKPKEDLYFINRFEKAYTHANVRLFGQPKSLGIKYTPFWIRGETGIRYKLHQFVLSDADEGKVLRYTDDLGTKYREKIASKPSMSKEIASQYNSCMAKTMATAGLGKVVTPDPEECFQ